MFFWSHNNSVRWAGQVSAYFISEKKSAQKLNDFAKGYIVRTQTWAKSSSTGVTKVGNS